MAAHRGRPTLLPGLLLALALGVAVWERAPALWDDRSWFDESFVFLESMGISFAEPWPVQYVRSELNLSPGLGKVFYCLIHDDPYPPFTHLVAWSFRGAPHPLLAARALFVLCGLGLIATVYVLGSRLAGPDAGALLAAYVGLSPMLTTTGQELKWYAAAPLLATLATGLLIHLDGRSRGGWAAYVVCLLLLLETHYFCIWILPAHALFAWWRRPALRGRFAAAFAVTLLLYSPWLLWALPKQLLFVHHQFGDVFQTWPYNAWLQPAAPTPIAASWLYTLLAMIGAEPSPIRARYFVPLAVGAVWLLWRGGRAADPRRRDFVFASVLTFALAVAAQTAYSLKLGQTIPLTATYFAPWCPMIMIAVMLGALDLGNVRARAVVAGALVAVAALNVAFLGPPRRAIEADSLSNYRDVAALLSAPRDVPSAIVFRSDRDAKMVNVFYQGPALQMIWPADAKREVPPGVGALIVVSAASSSPMSPPPGWTREEPDTRLGYTRIDVLRHSALHTRGSPVVGPMSRSRPSASTRNAS
jgi:hypothetical protein